MAQNDVNQRLEIIDLAHSGVDKQKRRRFPCRCHGRVQSGHEFPLLGIIVKYARIDVNIKHFGRPGDLTTDVELKESLPIRAAPPPTFEDYRLELVILKSIERKVPNPFQIHWFALEEELPETRQEGPEVLLVWEGRLFGSVKFHFPLVPLAAP